MTEILGERSSMERPAVFDILRPVLEEELKKRVGKHRSPLHDMLRYQMGWIDEMRAPLSYGIAERTLGTVSLLAARAVGASDLVALPGAAAVELTGGFLAIHEDIRLGSPHRGERPALWWVWGHAQGINAGDGMYALARLALMDLGARGITPDRVLRATRLLDEACLEACEAQHAEIDLAETGRFSVAEYLRAVDGESGALMGAAAAIGAVAGCAPESTVEALHHFGRHIGIASRLGSDIATLWGRPLSAASSRILEVLDQRRSLPLLRAIESSTEADQQTIEALASRREPVEDQRLEALLLVMERSGAKKYAESTVREHLARGLEALGCSGIGEAGATELQRLARYLAQGDE